ncbi:MAG: proline--tRNA ligase [Simkaniaceae bacterium]|nr:proline--tRNA ligase [Simkaniaceae bacterium]
MSGKKEHAISPSRAENYSGWYGRVIRVADLAEHSPVRGCMVIKPNGYALWENIRTILDARLKATGHRNAYFPLFIPLSYLQREADHVEGFAKECAVVTHHKLVKDGTGALRPDGLLEEPLVVRPTSETMIGEMFAKWITSYRDLPLLINQWCNIVRWEMRTRLFLRTTEFLWQEGHTAHATAEEAMEEARTILDLYVNFIENELAIPVIKGEKTEKERFPGAVNTFTFEMMMQDGKALQGGTSHFLGRNFAKATNITFQSAKGTDEYAWTTSWGVTTRLIGGLIMVHGDDDGLILPPAVAPLHVVVIPVIHKEETKEEILAYCRTLRDKVCTLSYRDRPVECLIDDKGERSGEKVWSAIKRGIPVRVEIGIREVTTGTVSVGIRTLPPKERVVQSREEFTETLPSRLTEIRSTLFRRAEEARDALLFHLHSEKELYDFFSSSGKGFVYAYYAQDPAIEERIGNDLGVTVRCIPFDNNEESGTCIFTGKQNAGRALFAKAY